MPQSSESRRTVAMKSSKAASTKAGSKNGSGAAECDGAPVIAAPAPLALRRQSLFDRQRLLDQRRAAGNLLGKDLIRGFLGDGAPGGGILGRHLDDFNARLLENFDRLLVESLGFRHHVILCLLAGRHQG